MNSMRNLISLLTLLLVFSGCEDRGYGTQDISTVPSVTSTESVTLTDSIPKHSANIAPRSFINVAFSSYIDSNSLHTSDVSLTDTNSSTVEIELDAIRNYIYVRPQTSLTPDHNYTFLIITIRCSSIHALKISLVILLHRSIH